MPRPSGATVELRHATGTEPELLRQRGVLDGVCAVEFPVPKERFAGRGIVICGGGEKYLPSVYVLVRLLRHLRCGLPIEVWHLGKEEMPEAMRKLLEGLGAVCVDGLAMRRVHPARRLGGWELKCYALLHCAFAEVLLLDAEKCPVRGKGTRGKGTGDTWKRDRQIVVEKNGQKGAEWREEVMRTARLKAAPGFPAAHYHCISRVVERRFAFGEGKRDRQIVMICR